MKYENLAKKIKQEYEKEGFFPFLAKNAEGTLTKTTTINTDRTPINHSDYISKHPNSDLEKHFIKEILSIITFNEVLKTIKFLKTRELEDSEENIIIGKTDQIKKAAYFEFPLEKPICIRKKDIYVEDHELIISDFERINLGQNADSEIKSFILLGGAK